MKVYNKHSDNIYIYIYYVMLFVCIYVIINNHCVFLDIGQNIINSFIHSIYIYHVSYFYLTIGLRNMIIIAFAVVYYYLWLGLGVFFFINKSSFLDLQIVALFL